MDIKKKISKKMKQSCVALEEILAPLIAHLKTR